MRTLQLETELANPYLCAVCACRSRRSWKPNVVNKKLYSEVLDKVIPMSVTTHALRCIDNKGGLDNYLLKTKDEDIASIRGIELKKQISEIMKKFPNGFPDRQKASAAPKVEVPL
eukprot:1192106-Prorocentrum_minimum.AAC.4